MSVIRVSEQWLREFVDISSIPVKEFRESCDAAGLEVNSIDEVGADWDGIVVGEILSAEAHEKGKGHIVRVSTGTAEHTSFCGAPNVTPSSVGAKVPVATTGAKVRSGDDFFTVETRKVYGTPSEAVLCSEAELGISDDHDGILFLNSGLTPGTPLRDALGGRIYEFEITPDLGRCMSIRGLARELAALHELPFHGDLTTIPLPESPASIKVEIENSDISRRYIGVVIRNIEVKESSPEIQSRLLQGGMRPINNLVDIANYAMLELGQPFHFFDLDKLQGETIGVRMAREGETIEALNGTTYSLQPSNLLITDRQGPCAVAGVIGSEPTAVSATTTTVLLEAAHFDMYAVLRSCQGIKLRTDAAERFLKGLDPEACKAAAERVLALLKESCPGAEFVGTTDAYPYPSTPRELVLTPHEVERILGVAIEAGTLATWLEGFDFTCRVDGEHIRVTVPTSRPDVIDTSHLIEEVARRYGFNRIPAKDTMQLYLQRTPLDDEPRGIQEALTRHLCAQGYAEAMNYSLVSEEEAGITFDEFPGEPVPVANPLTVDKAALRRSLFPGLLRNVALNLKHYGQVRLFEFGKVYFQGPDDTVEPNVLGIVWAGAEGAPDWLAPATKKRQREAEQFFDLKGLLTGLLESLGVPRPAFEGTEIRYLWPGRTTRVRIGNQTVALLGDVHPHHLSSFNIENTRVSYLEVFVDRLLHQLRTTPRFAEPIAEPPVNRDLAFIADEGVSSGAIDGLIREVCGPDLIELALFDRFVGEQVGPGKVSLAYTLKFQRAGETLRAEDIDQVLQRVTGELETRFKVHLRT